MTNKAKTNKAKTNKAMTNKAKTNKAKTNKAKTDKAKTNKAKTEQLKLKKEELLEMRLINSERNLLRAESEKRNLELNNQQGALLASVSARTGLKQKNMIIHLVTGEITSREN
ncbi:MAG: hypothetical protein KAT58_08005 [candidate division Zixibacteria bacterium]|nr:hypothetical protein [candidate division Zixibacteria bacterium]